MPKKIPKPAERVLRLTISYPDRSRTVEFRPAEMTPKISRKVRQETGVSVAKAMVLVETDPDLDLIAAIVYAGALQADMTADLEELEEWVTYDAEYEVDFGAETETSDPEA